MEDVNAPPTPKSEISFITPLLISTIGILATALALVTYHLIVLRYCRRRQRNNSTSIGNMEAGATALDERLNTGVDEKVLAKIPITIYQDSPSTDHPREECAVCLGELEDGDAVRILPGCKHAFHVPCIDRWLFSRTTCPVCRSRVAAPVDDDEEVTVAVVPVLPVPARVDEDRDDGLRASTSRLQLQPFPLLRHCVSLVLPKERRLQYCSPGRIRLKRSLSWDQTFVFIDIQRDCPSNYNSSLRRSRSLRIQSIRQFHRVSSKFLRSFSRLHVGQRTGILPL